MPDSEMNKRVVWVCQKCVARTISARECKCWYCGTKMIPTDINVTEYESAKPGEQGDYYSDIFERYVKQSGLYDQSVGSQRALRETNMEVQKTDQNQVLCPKCGSNQIQIAQKKWSLWSGFLTNKVDRVCVRCKHRW